MIASFRHFMRDQYFPCSIREEEAAPSIGSSPSTPGNPDNSTTNKYHFDSLKQQFGIGDDEMTAALEGDPIQIWQVPDYSSKWGYLVSGPCSAIVKQRTDGNYDITFQLAQKKLMNPQSFIMPYKKGERPLKFDGEVTDQKEIISSEELQDIMTKPLATGGMPQGGGMGADPSMGGAPPMGGPMGAPAGGVPPMGGM